MRDNVNNRIGSYGIFEYFDARNLRSHFLYLGYGAYVYVFTERENVAEREVSALHFVAQSGDYSFFCVGVTFIDVVIHDEFVHAVFSGSIDVYAQ